MRHCTAQPASKSRHGCMPGRVIVPAVCLVSALCLLQGCRDKDTDTATPVVHNMGCDVWPDSIDLHEGVILHAVGDSMLQVRVEGNVLRTVQVPELADGVFSFSSDYPLFDALYRLEASATRHRQWEALSVYELYLNPFPVSDWSRLLDSRIKHNLVVPTEGGRYSWPVINDNAPWLLAAMELCKVSGNRRWLRTLGDVTAGVINEDCITSRNNFTGLFNGIPRYMAGSDIPLPGWMAPAEVSRVQTLAVNVMYWAALDGMNAITLAMAKHNEHPYWPELPVDADSLRHAVNRELWMPANGTYSALAYGVPMWPLQLHSSDNLAQGLAILTGMVSRKMAQTIISKTPTGVYGPAPFSPRLTNRPPSPGTFAAVKAIWAAAAARTDNKAAYDAALSGVLSLAARDVLSNDTGKWFGSAIAGLVLRGFLGMEMAFDGIRFSPSVPHGMPGAKHITGLRYRHSSLDITITGTGNILSAFTIDGHQSAPFFPASSEGRHTIEITLAEADAHNGSITADEQCTLPPHPVVSWNTECEAAILPVIPASTVRDNAGSNVTMVYLNGVPTGYMPKHTYKIDNTEQPATVQFTEIDNNGVEGFSAEPHLFVPNGRQSKVHLAGVARGGTKVIKDRQLAAQFVETDRLRNRNIKFEYNAAQEGEYLIDVHYISGLGIVNQRRRTALRTLVVDGERCGVFLFPQRSPSSRDYSQAADWQTLTSYSNPLTVHLKKGVNNMELRLYQPSPIYVSPTANTVLADFVRIIRL